MLRRFDTRRDSRDALRAVFEARLENASRAAEESVRTIIEEVRSRGDEAVLEYTRRWDCPRAERLHVPPEEIEAAAARMHHTALWPVMRASAERIRAFHEKQRRNSWIDTQTPGEIMGQIIRPVARAGVYVPGGTAAYPSTVLMSAIPAVVAGVKTVVVATPPNAETGLPPDATLAAARLAGVSEVYAVGGAQAIAALAYGTATVARVDKIAGPGNLYVNLAKRLVYGAVGIDMLAGPSEVAILADESADPCAAAADVLTQTEHDPNCSALIATPSEEFAEAVLDEIERQTRTLPRADIVKKALTASGYLVVTETLEEAADVVSLYAPEHLHVDVRDPWAILSRIESAGSILIGRDTSAPIGDYMAGPSHTLPTAACARFSSPLSVDDFYKKSSVIYLSAAAAAPLSEAAATFAEFEGLEGHARAARRRHGPAADV